MNNVNLDLAFKIAVEQHDGQFRKGSGLPYVKHVLDVAEKLNSWGFYKNDFPHLWAIAYLHDVLEDGNHKKLVATQIAINFDGIVLNKVRELTFDPEKQTKQEYINGLVNASPEALVVKFADRWCNTIDFTRAKDYKYAKKYLGKFSNVIKPGLIKITSAYGEEKAKLIMQDMDLITNITNMAWSIT